MSNITREIRENERELVLHMLELAKLNKDEFAIPELVYEYEGGKMGSINFLHSEIEEEYAGDILALEFNDEDKVRVVITLTIDKKQQLLDLDFWKEDFNALIKYPHKDITRKFEGL